MKRIFLIITALTMVLLSAGCGMKNRGGDIDNVQISYEESSEIYSDDDIDAAYKTILDYFSSEFEGCALTKLYYPGDTYTDEFNELAEQYGADEAIIIMSSFDVDSSGGDGSLNPDSTYDNWQWILTRNTGGEWEHIDHGYYLFISDTTS